MQLSAEQVNSVEQAIISRGVHLIYTREELLDHLCCMVEEHMAFLPFEKALQQSLSLFPAPEWQELEATTHHLLIQTKLKTMNKTLRVSGILSALLIFTGTLFKIMHWPGASLLLLIGMVAMAMLFLPLYFIIRHQTAGESNRNVVLSISGALTGVCIVCGILFKFFHWPGANVLIYTGTGLLLLGYLPVYMLTVYRKSLNRVQAISTMVLIVAAGSTFLLANNKGPSSEMKRSMAKVIIEQEKQLKDHRTLFLMQQQKSMLSAETSAQITAFQALLNSADSLKRSTLLEAEEPADNYLAVFNWDKTIQLYSPGHAEKEGSTSIEPLISQVKEFNLRGNIKLHLPDPQEYRILPISLILQKLTLEQSRWIIEFESQQ